MKNNKTNARLIVVLLLIICFLLIGGGFLVYKLLSNNSNNNSGVDEDFNNESTNFPEWVTYLTDYDLTLTKSVWSNEQCNFVEVNISSDDIDKVIQKLSTSKITKYYYGDMPPTGTVCSDRYQLKFGDKSISLEADGIAWVKDTTLSSKLDLVVSATQGSGQGDYVYRFDVNFADVINNIK